MFEYFDDDLDDKISFEELVKYLTAMFSLVLKTLKDPDLEFMDAKKLAAATARNCFNHLNIEEVVWIYSLGPAFGTRQLPEVVFGRREEILEEALIYLW